MGFASLGCRFGWTVDFCSVDRVCFSRSQVLAPFGGRVCESTSKHGVTLHNVFESMIANLDPNCNNVVKTVCLRSLSNVRFFNFQIHKNFEQGDTAYHWDCVQRSYQWYGILDLINPAYLPDEPFLTVDKLLPYVVSPTQLPTSFRWTPVTCPTNFRRMSDQFRFIFDWFSMQLRPFSIGFEQISSWWSTWTPLWRTTTTWSTSSPRWWSLLGQC